MSDNISYIQQGRQDLIALITTKMPFGKYKGRTLCDLPEPYLVWFKQKGFPEGKLGKLLAMMYEIKAEGVEIVLYELRKRMKL